MKITSIIALIIGLCFIAAGIFCAEFVINGLMVNEDISEYSMNSMIRYTEFSLLAFGGVTVFCALLGWIFHKKTIKWCSLKTTTVAMGISAMGSLGIQCVLSFLSCYFLSSPAKHPIRHPASVCVGMIALCVFVLLAYLYIKLRKDNKSLPGILLDVGLGLVYLAPFFFVWGAADSILSSYI